MNPIQWNDNQMLFQFDQCSHQVKIEDMIRYFRRYANTNLPPCVSALLLQI